MVVLLPAPLGPTYPKTSPDRTSRSIPTDGLDRPVSLDQPLDAEGRAGGDGGPRLPLVLGHGHAHSRSATQAMAASRSASPNRLNLPGTIQPNAVARWATHPRSLTTAVRFQALA